MRTLDEAKYCHLNAPVLLQLTLISKLWQITIDASPSLAELKQHVRPGAETNPCLTGLRSICWKVRTMFVYEDRCF